MKGLNYIAGIGALVSACALDSPGYWALGIFVICAAWIGFYYHIIYKNQEEIK